MLIQIPEANKPHQDYADIQQGSTEPYMTFLDRLKAAKEKQVTDDPVKEKLFKQLAVVNANSECKTVLQVLPCQLEPTIPQMVEACNKLTTSEHMAKMQAQVSANALNNSQQKPQSQQNQKTRSNGQ